MNIAGRTWKQWLMDIEHQFILAGVRSSWSILSTLDLQDPFKQNWTAARFIEEYKKREQIPQYQTSH